MISGCWLLVLRRLLSILLGRLLLLVLRLGLLPVLLELLLRLVLRLGLLLLLVLRRLLLPVLLGCLLLELRYGLLLILLWLLFIRACGLLYGLLRLLLYLLLIPLGCGVRGGCHSRHNRLGGGRLRHRRGLCYSRCSRRRSATSRAKFCVVQVCATVLTKCHLNTPF